MNIDKIQPPADSFDADLRHDPHAGLNRGAPSYRLRPAFDIKQLHDRLHSFDNGELRNIMVLEDGEQLEQGAVYFDLLHPELGEFKATGGDTAREGQCLVPKSETDYLLWNRLIGVIEPERLEQR